jgi:uncharacterized protein YkwD
VTWLDRLVALVRPAPRPVLPPGPPPPPAPPNPGEAAAGLLAATNRARAAAGLPALKSDPRLDRTAQAWAAECARAEKLTHIEGASTPWTRMTAAGVKYASASENAAMGQTSSSRVISDWLADPPHAANVLSRAFTHCGGGCAAGKDGRLWWVQDYAAE